MISKRCIWAAEVRPTLISRWEQCVEVRAASDFQWELDLHNGKCIDFPYVFSGRWLPDLRRTPGTKSVSTQGPAVTSTSTGFQIVLCHLTHQLQAPLPRWGGNREFWSTRSSISTIFLYRHETSLFKIFCYNKDFLRRENTDLPMTGAKITATCAGAEVDYDTGHLASKDC